MRFLILIIFYSTILFLAIRPKLSIIIEKNDFYHQNKTLIDETVSIFEEKCRPKKDIDLKIKFDFLPEQIVDINPYQNGLTSIFKTESFVEVNKSKFYDMDDVSRKNLLLHEVGHAIGLGHVDQEEDVMNPAQQKKVDYNAFFKKIENHCKQMEDVPREIDFLSKS